MDRNFGAFWNNKKVLITGHNGFKGTWLSLMLEYLGAKVYGYALLPQAEGFYRKAKPHMSGEKIGDIRDEREVYTSIEKFQPEIIIHLASHSTIDPKAELTHYIFETNTMGVVNVLEAAQKVLSVQAVLVVTSDKCYKNLESDEAYSERSLLGAQDPYSTSKACQELVTECYRNSFFGEDKKNIRVATARASNVIGGGDYNLSRLIPSLLNDLLKKGYAEIRKPNAVRPWQNVLDVLYGYLLLAKALYETSADNMEICAAFNFGPRIDGFLTVEEVAQRACGLLPGGRYIVKKDMNVVPETVTLKLNSSKAERVLGWFPKYQFNDTLKMTFDFLRREEKGENVKIIAMEYIEKTLGE